ncbi:MAG: kelch repeat-containing protein [Thermoplasmatota archaeon]
MAVILLFMTMLPLVPTQAEDITVQEETRAIGDTAMGDWSLISTGGWPPSISTENCNIMYREEQDELVVFNREDPIFEVWSYFGGNDTWIRWTTSGQAPDGRLSSQAFTSNWNNSIAYYYGGYVWGGSYSDKLNIFHYDSKSWIEVTAPSSLGARYWSEMIYDNSTESIWIYGGRDSSWNRHSDLHKYNITDGWVQYEPSTRPRATDQPLATITPNGSFIYIALGRYQSGGGGSSYNNDVWEFDVSAGDWREINGDLGIPTEAGGILQYRKETDDLILSMGFDGNNQLNNTYLINITSGSLRRVYITGGMSGRHVQAWDLISDRKTAVFFGSDGGARDIWAMGLQNYTSYLMPGNPTWQGGSAFTGYDPDNGGRLLALKYINGNDWQLASFSLAEKRWRSLYISDQNTPDYHSGMASCYDPVENEFYLYGGYYRYTQGWDEFFYFYKEFWKMDVDTGIWTLVNPDPAPGPRGRAAMTMDIDKRMIYLFGGQVPGGTSNSDATYSYNITGNLWKILNLNTKPPARMSASLAFSAERKGFYLFGGQQNASGQNDPTFNDLWLFHANTNNWEKLPTGDEEPSTQYGAGLSVNADNGELLLYGPENYETFFYRDAWRGWRNTATYHRPGDWSGHGMAYSTDSKSHFAWAGDGTQVWEFNPILRTTANQIRIYNPKGETSPTSPIPVFPTLGTYQLVIDGKTDLPISDLTGVNLKLTLGAVNITFAWDREGNTLDMTENSWFILPDDPSFDIPDEGEWELTIPVEFTFQIPHGLTVGATALPITETGYPESTLRTQLFTTVSDLEIVSYNFRTPLQSQPNPNGWLYGNTNLTVYDFRVAFRQYSDRSPVEADGLTASLQNQFGDVDTWDYIYNTSGELTVPIKGQNKQNVLFYLNLSEGDEVLRSLDFTFKLDTDLPIVEGAVIRADSEDDDMIGVDQDAIVYLTWDRVLESGSGLKGVCYSVDTNLWPQEVNLTNEFKQLQIISEGPHMVYVWAKDNAGRVGPYVEAPIFIDSHWVYFTEINPAKQVNITYSRFVVSLTINDELSGVDHSSIYYKKSLPDRQLSDWMKYDIANGSSKSVKISMELELVPGIINLIQFKANDMAYNGDKESPYFRIHYDPELAVPKVTPISPENGDEAEDSQTLTWEADYINPNNLTYELHVIMPNGEENTYTTSQMKWTYNPSIPGLYKWYVVAKADGKETTSVEFTFWYYLPFVDVLLPNLSEFKKGESQDIQMTLKNTLDIPITVSFSLNVDWGFSMEGNTEFQLGAGDEITVSLRLNSSSAELGSYTLKLNASDDYGRWSIIDLKVRVVKADGVKDDDGGGGGGMSLYMVIGIVVGILLFLAFILILFLIIRSRREAAEDDKKAKTEEYECFHCGKIISKDDPSCPHCGMFYGDGSVKDGEYDPRGIVKEGKGIESSVPLSPGLATTGEKDHRERGRGHILELELPKKEEMVPREEEEELEDMEELSADELAEELYRELDEE